MTPVTINVSITQNGAVTDHAVRVPASPRDERRVAKDPYKVDDTISDIAQKLLDGQKVILKQGVKLSAKMIKKAVLEVAPQLTFRVIKLGLGVVSIIAL